MEKLTTLDRAIRLQKVELFSDLDTDLLALLASIAQQIEVPEGETLVAQDAEQDSLYVVLEGRIEMARDGAPMFSVGPDETVGNWALFDRQPSLAAARAVESSCLLKIDREDFFDLLADHSEMNRELFQALFRRMRSVLAKGLDTAGIRTTGDSPAGGV
jgi:CRP-like cAMP-binding protein